METDPFKRESMKTYKKRLNNLSYSRSEKAPVAKQAESTTIDTSQQPEAFAPNSGSDEEDYDNKFD